MKKRKRKQVIIVTALFLLLTGAAVGWLLWPVNSSITLFDIQIIDKRVDIKNGDCYVRIQQAYTYNDLATWLPDPVDVRSANQDFYDLAEAGTTTPYYVSIDVTMPRICAIKENMFQSDSMAYLDIKAVLENEDVLLKYGKIFDGGKGTE